MDCLSLIAFINNSKTLFANFTCSWTGLPKKLPRLDLLPGFCLGLKQFESCSLFYIQDTDFDIVDTYIYVFIEHFLLFQEMLLIMMMMMMVMMMMMMNAASYMLNF